MSTEATKYESYRIGSGDRKKELHNRLFEFAEKVKEFLSTIPSSPENKTIISYLSRSAGLLSDCSNEEKSVLSKTEFSYDPTIASLYLRELDCWLRITKRQVKEIIGSDLEYLIKESGELKALLDTIVQKS